MKCEFCNGGIGNRRRVGPTGNNDFNALVESCYRCGMLYPVFPETLSYKENEWIRRYNERMQRNYEDIRIS